MKRFAFAALMVCFLAVQTASGSIQDIPLSGASASFSQTGFGIAYAVDGSLDSSHGWAVHPNENVNQWAIFDTDVEVVSGSTLTFTLSQLFAGTTNPYHLIHTFQLSVIDAVTHTATAVEPVVVSATSNLSVTGTVVNNLDYHKSTLPKTDIFVLTAISPYTQIEGFRLDLYAPVGTQPSNSNFVLTEFSVTGDIAPEPAAICIWGLLAVVGLAVAWYRRAV